MKFHVCRLTFLSEVHIGNGMLADSEYTMHADTFFSALCQEAFKIYGESGIKELVDLAETEQFILSDGLPYVGDRLYFPKPLDNDFLSTLLKEKMNASSVHRKMLKKLNYIPLSVLMQQEEKFNVEKEVETIKNIGTGRVRMKASVKGLDEPEPYGVGGFQFASNNGMYFLFGIEEKIYDYIKNLLDSLKFTGIGGKLSSGMGKFEYQLEEISEQIVSKLCYGKKAEKEKNVMTLNVSLPNSNMEEILKNGFISILKRSGFVSSPSYTVNMKNVEGYTKKKNLYVFSAGSCLATGYDGNIIDLKDKDGKHSVYRYAKPLFWRLGE